MNIKFEEIPSVLGKILTEIEDLKCSLYIKEHSNSKILTIDAVSLLLNKSIHTLYKYCSQKQIPHFKQGNTNYFIESEIIEWIKEGRVNVNPNPLN